MRRIALLSLLLGLLSVQIGVCYDLKATAGGDGEDPSDDEETLAGDAFVADCFATIGQGFPYPIRLFFADEHTYAMQLNVRRVGAMWIEHIIKPMMGEEGQVPSVEEFMKEGLGDSPFRGYSAGYDHNYPVETVSLMGDGPGVPPLIRTFAHHGTPLDDMRANFPVWGAYGENITQLYNEKASAYIKKELTADKFRDMTFGFTTLQRLLYPKHLLSGVLSKLQRIKRGKDSRGFVLDEDNTNVNKTTYTTRVYWWGVQNDKLKRYNNLPFTEVISTNAEDILKTKEVMHQSVIGYVRAAVRHEPGSEVDGDVDQIDFYTTDADVSSKHSAVVKLLVLHNTKHKMKPFNDMDDAPNPDFDEETF